MVTPVGLKLPPENVLEPSEGAVTVFAKAEGHGVPSIPERVLPMLGNTLLGANWPEAVALNTMKAIMVSHATCLVITASCCLGNNPAPESLPAF